MVAVRANNTSLPTRWFVDCTLQVSAGIIQRSQPLDGASSPFKAIVG